MHSMHRAAEHLFISAQGLGKIIKNLEHESDYSHGQARGVLIAKCSL